MEDFKTMAIFSNSNEYIVLKHLLEQAEILFMFQNETIISVLPFHSNKYGGIRLKVHPDHIKKAEKIISSLS